MNRIENNKKKPSLDDSFENQYADLMADITSEINEVENNDIKEDDRFIGDLENLKASVEHSHSVEELKNIEKIFEDLKKQIDDVKKSIKSDLSQFQSSVLAGQSKQETDYKQVADAGRKKSASKVEGDIEILSQGNGLFGKAVKWLKDRAA